MIEIHHIGDVKMWKMFVLESTQKVVQYDGSL